ncbi:MAG: desulfoferrodoxin family protein [bacterium]|nr:desulfoferrodoxin family protein [bacterium]
MMKFFKCNNDGLVIPITKCFTSEASFAEAQEITPNSVDAAKEKHMPVVTLSGDTVTVNVGSVSHPMSEEHSITTVVLETQNGGQYKFLPHDSDPVVHFKISDGDKPLAAYAYCNLHGLWKADID